MRRASMARMGDLGDVAWWDDFRDAADDAIEAVGPIFLSIVESVIALFPGIGSALATAIATGIALARGRPIDEVIIAATSGAIPGGPLAQTAYRTAVILGTKIARGEPLAQIVIEEARAQLPGGIAQTVFDAGINIARGRDIGDAALGAMRAQLPAGVLRTAFDTTVKIARGQSVDQAAIDLVMANLPPAYRSAFMTGVAVARGAPLGGVAIAVARAAAERQGASALAAFDLSIPLSTGTPLDAMAIKAVRDRIPAVDLPQFDQTIATAHAVGLQSGGFGDASTFMPWTGRRDVPLNVWDNAAGVWRAGPSSSEVELADKAYDFAQASAYGVAHGETGMAVVMRALLTELSQLDDKQFTYYAQIVEHLAANRSDFEHDLQDVEVAELTRRYDDLYKASWQSTPLSEAIVRAALGSVPYTIKPPFTSRKDKRRGEADITASFQRAIPAALERRARITNTIKVFHDVDGAIASGWGVEMIYAFMHGTGGARALDIYGGENNQITREQIYNRIHLLAAKGQAQDDFEEWHLLDDEGGKAAATWKTEADFLAAPTLPNAAEYRRRAELEKQLAARVLEGTASGPGKDLLDKAADDLVRAAALDIIEFAANIPVTHSYGRPKPAAPVVPLAPTATVIDADAQIRAATAAGTAAARADNAALASAAKARQIKVISIAGAAGALLLLGTVAMKRIR